MAALIDLTIAARSLRRPLRSSPICSSCFHRLSSRLTPRPAPLNSRILQQQQQQQQQRTVGRRFVHQHTPEELKAFEKEHKEFYSVLDEQPQLVRVQKRKLGAGVLLLALIPLTAFALGTWQVQRLEWKTDLIARLEDQISRPPLPLPPHLDPSAVPEFDHRRVFTRGVLRHDQEMLIGPRIREGANGYIVVTPLERKDSLDAGLSEDDEGKKGGSTILVNRGWISRDLANQEIRRKISEGLALPEGEVLIEGLLRRPFKKNMFTPNNVPEKKQFYFPDVEEMAKLVGAQPVWMEETYELELFDVLNRQSKGIPIGRPAEVELRNTHFQYIVTWYSLGLATSVMLYMFLKRPPREFTRKLRHSNDWA